MVESERGLVEIGGGGGDVGDGRSWSTEGGEFYRVEGRSAWVGVAEWKGVCVCEGGV